jgi:hypothetical protein
MHRNSIWAVVRGTLILALGPAISVHAAPRQRPCAAIRKRGLVEASRPADPKLYSFARAAPAGPGKCGH